MSLGPLMAVRPRMQAANAPAGDEKPVGGEDFAGVVGDGDVGADAGDGAVGGSEITGAVIEDGYCGRHRRSFLGNL